MAPNEPTPTHAHREETDETAGHPAIDDPDSGRECSICGDPIEQGTRAPRDGAPKHAACVVERRCGITLFDTPEST